MQFEVDGLAGILTTPAPSLVLSLFNVDRAQAAIYGADVGQVGIAVQLVTNGIGRW